MTGAKMAWLTFAIGTSALTWTSMIWREWHVTLLLIQTEFQPRSSSPIRPGLLASRLSRPSLRRHCSKYLLFH